MNKLLTTFFTIALSTAVLFPADAQSRNNRSMANRSPEMSEAVQKEWATLQQSLAKKDPKAFAEIRKLAETNLPAAFSKMQILAGKHNLKTPSRTRSGRNFHRNRGQSGDRNAMRRRWQEGGDRGNMRGRGGFSGRGGMGMARMNPAQKRKDAETAIAGKFPKEYAAYVKAKEENLLKIRELAKKSSVKLPANTEEMAYVSKKYEKELQDLSWRERFAKLRELLEKEGYEMSFGNFGGAGLPATAPKPAPPARRDFSRNDLARKAKQQYPEEWQQYVELNRKDKAAARKKLEELLKKVK